VCPGKEHAQRNEQVSQDFRIACQSICEQNVTKLPIRSLSDAANADSLQRRERPAPSIARNERYGCDKADNEYEEVQVREDLPACNVLRGARRQGPEEQERQCERDREESRDAVAGEVVRGVMRGGT
jgi:hypothetical protein